MVCRFGKPTKAFINGRWVAIRVRKVRNKNKYSVKRKTNKGWLSF